MFEGEEVRNIFFEGKHLVRAGEDKERRRKSRKIFGLWRRKERGWERRKILEEGKILVTSIDQPPTTAG